MNVVGCSKQLVAGDVMTSVIGTSASAQTCSTSHELSTTCRPSCRRCYANCQ